MTESIDKTKRHYIRGVVKKDNLFYIPLIQISKFCLRFPATPAKTIGDMITNALKELESNEELLKKVPEVIVNKESDGGINGSPEKEA